MKQITKIKRLKEQYHKCNSKSRKCPMCKIRFKNEKCTHTYKDAADYLFIEYTKAVLGIM